MRRSGRILLLFCALPLAAGAASITWTINATLSDGATVTGSFVFDPDLGSQTLTNFDIVVSAATPGTLIEPGDDGLPTSVFFPFGFTPTDSSGSGPLAANHGAFDFLSNTMFPNPLPGGVSEKLVLGFVPLSPLTDASGATITNSSIDINDPFSVECFNCRPYVCYQGATSALCVGASGSPEPRAWALAGIGLLVVLGFARRSRPTAPQRTS